MIRKQDALDYHADGHSQTRVPVDSRERCQRHREYNGPGSVRRTGVGAQSGKRGKHKGRSGLSKPFRRDFDSPGILGEFPAKPGGSKHPCGHGNVAGQSSPLDDYRANARRTLLRRRADLIGCSSSGDLERFPAITGSMISPHRRHTKPAARACAFLSRSSKGYIRPLQRWHFIEPLRFSIPGRPWESLVPCFAPALVFGSAFRCARQVPTRIGWILAIGSGRKN
jgi:hypothetical protein